MKILFVDTVGYKSYDDDTLRNEPLGGTEATVVRVSEGLAKAGIPVQVVQRVRTTVSTNSAVYAPINAAKDFVPTHIVTLRTAAPLDTIRQQFPNAKLYVWYHDLFSPGAAFVKDCESLVRNSAKPICVSTFHAEQFVTLAKGCGFSIPCKRIYNPVADELKPAKPLTYDANKIVFFSSPHKGLEDTLTLFKNFQNFPELKDVKLYIANPGYYADKDTGGIKNVVNLGALTHDGVIDHVRDALCVFHFNRVFPETFGLVHAESNAVGTPFLTGNVGANRELMDHPHQCMDLSDPKPVIDRLMEWKKYGRPPVRGDEKFRLKKIVKEWREFLGAS